MSRLRTFVVQSTSVLLDVDPDALNESLTDDILDSFATDAKVLCIHQDLLVSTEVTVSSKAYAVFICTVDSVVESMPVNQQIQVQVAPGCEDPAAALNQIYLNLNLSCSAVIKSIPSLCGGSEEAATLGKAIPSVGKKVHELEYALRGILNRLEIPEVRLAIDPTIVTASENMLESTQSLDELGLGEDVRDTQMLNRLQQGVGRWTKEIQKVTKIEHETAPSVGQEVAFWVNMEQALAQIQRQVDSNAVKLTLDVLKQSRRALPTILFENDTGLASAIKRVKSCMILFQDIPIGQLLAAGNIEQLRESLVNVFNHLKKLKSADEYPLLHAFRLIESLSRDTSSQLLSILDSHRLVLETYEKFDIATCDCQSLFSDWEEHVRLFKELLRELAKKRGGARLPQKMLLEHTPLQERLSEFREFRKSHERFRSVIEVVIGPEENDETLNEVNSAYKLVSNVDILDVTTTAAWDEVKKQYERRIDRIERRIIERLTDKLGAADTADEMFRVFSRFNPLFFRHRIRGAIQQFQASLIKRVETDIEELQKTFKKSYGQSQASLMSRELDVPPVAGAIIWARQIELQLDTYLDRVATVLGSNWEQHLEGRRLKETGMAFKKKLNTQAIFEHWIKSIQAVPSFEVTGRLLDVNEHRKLVVNFDSQIVELFKEVRNLQWLGFRIPYTLKVIADEAREKYPYAMTLSSTIQTFINTMEQMDSQLQVVLSGNVRQVQKLIQSTFQKSPNWDSDGLGDFCNDLCQRVYDLQAKVMDASDKNDQIKELLAKMKSCETTQLEFNLDAIQKILDEMNLASYSSLSVFTSNLEKTIEHILKKRLDEGLEKWLEDFQIGEFQTTHEIILQKHKLDLEPPLEEARCLFFASIHKFIESISNLSRLQSSRYDKQETVSTYGTAVVKNNAALSQLYGRVESRLLEVRKYVNTWLQYQVLWDMDASVVDGKISTLDVWYRLLQDLQGARATFESSQHSKQFGSVKVDYQQVQAQISLRYDAWQKEMLLKFANVLQGEMREFYDQIVKMRQDLESIDSISNPVKYVVVVYNIRDRREDMHSRISLFGQCERVAQRQRFVFPSNWIWNANVQGEWDAFEQIYSRRYKLLEDDLPSMQAKITQEHRSVESKIVEFCGEWTESKPVSGMYIPDEALTTIGVFETKCLMLEKEWESVEQATSTFSGKSSTSSLETVKVEIKGMKEVWSSLRNVSTSLHDLKETPWTAVVPRKLRASLEALLEQLRNLPGRVRQYEAFEQIQVMIRDYKNGMNYIVELRSESLKDRHWRQVVKLLQLQNIPELTLGDLWNADLKKHGKEIGDVCKTAQGEMALEEFMRQIREYWTGLELDLVSVQRCKLIRGWDDLFSQLDEHLVSLSSMKLSPFFKVFEDESVAWEEKLGKIKSLLDIWIDVQRRWVYLGGILLGSADIKQQLPNEYSKFVSIDSDFCSLMQKVAHKPGVLEVLSFVNEQNMSRLAENLEKVQRALGDYLERQRQGFSRFYFVGDEDLLEIIGNSKDPVKIQRHMSKMFAGIASLTLDPEETISSMVSREGELVPFVSKVQLEPKVSDWLLQVEKEMKKSLEYLLESCSKSFYSLSQDKLLEWIENTPSQIVILAAQVAWSSKVADVSFIEKTLIFLAACRKKTKKLTQLITELVHQRDVLRSVRDEFDWLSQIRYEQTENSLVLNIANARFDYGFEYLGVSERLVQTPLTDRCYLALTQALHFRLGGNPFGPAGTGKTESVKALGAQLGRFVLVFNCDEHFDLHAMGRIFVGLCQVGAWGCFDEFNRLEERILSAVSQQILTIQRGLLEKDFDISLINKPVHMNPNVGIFVTMNPGYAGRSNLPDNLKQLFRSIAMIEPDRELIAQVMLYSQGFKTAESLANHVIMLFKLCQSQLSSQPHYDFGLRAVKSVLMTAGLLLRRSEESDECSIVVKSLSDNIVPKLVVADAKLFGPLLIDVFGSSFETTNQSAEEQKLVECVRKVCETHNLVCSDDWLVKIMQLNRVQELQHGVMMVGPCGCGKSSSWRTLLQAKEMVDGIKGEFYVIDPKALSKEELYGVLDPTTMEWTNGVFTHILRKILNNVRGEQSKRHWIVFDGDVDPEWAENLNSVLDDNKLLTLPNGERLSIPDNVRIMFEVETLRFATLATVSRCGMVWYSQSTLKMGDILSHHGYSSNSEFVEEMIEQSLVGFAHTMKVNRMQLVTSFLAIYRKTGNVIYSLLWGTGGSMDNESRLKLAELITKRTVLPLPENNIWDYDSNYTLWKTHVPQLSIESHRVVDTNMVISTVDTIRHADVLSAYLGERLPVILCGPPGSGKTMSLTSVLKSMPNTVIASLNFSSATNVQHVLKTLEQHCVYRKNILAPPLDKWLVVFCDEVNLPAADKYGTQNVITFMRMLIEHKGFWSKNQWITVQNVQFVSACNPPTDPGRVVLGSRFLRHAPLIYVDYPTRDSLFQIYGTFNRAMLKAHPKIRAHGDAMTEAMIEFYFANKKKFLADVAPHYVYSPRELSRWMRGIYEAIADDLNHLVRLFVHEGLRLFHDRLITSEEKEWCVETLDNIARNRFPGADFAVALKKPVIFSNWLTKDYASVDMQELRSHVEARLKVFYEEELNVPLVVFDDVLEHVLRIDRVLRQPLGHLLLVGKSGAGKTVLTRFVSWMNGIRVFQIKLSRKYTLDHFDDDLRYVLKRSQEEKICFIFDESNILDSAFLERMNALLASGEVPGLFEGEELPEAFTWNVQRNLHVVFTMNPSSSDLKNRAATSPALFNRCVVDWFGDWSHQALHQVGFEFTQKLDMDDDHSFLVESLVIIHEEIVLTRNENCGPRDYLDLITHFVSLFRETKAKIEDQQLHLNIGLDKLRETSNQVEELNKSLLIKETELEAKNIQANEKLQQMVTDQNEAEKKKADAEKLSIDLDSRSTLIQEQKDKAQEELGRAEPALLDAQKAVSDIRKAHLDEMRSLSNPPPLIKLTLEAVCIMLGLEYGSWTGIRRALQKREFIPDVVNFNSSDLSAAQRQRVQALLDNNPDFVEEKVFNANRACVALFKWIVSQLEYAGILLKIQPLRDQISILNKDADELATNLKAEREKIVDLEEKIVQYKNEYAILITECESLKSEMGAVQTKVSRSKKLLSSLDIEKERWEQNNLREQMVSLVGDVLVSAAFITYAGFFDYRARQELYDTWKKIYENPDINIISFLSKPSERLQWHQQKLPNDSLCIENGIILKRFNRFPLVVDPSGQGVAFLMNHIPNMTKTSFLDGNFMKTLESALRFGNSILVTDVENIDPILNPVLNREIHRTGGRTLVRLGDQDIDFSPSFNMFMTTRDSSFAFSPDICSRVTFVNFTATPHSLQAQCLSKILKHNRPDIYEQNMDLIKLQGEYQARLRELEEELLESINFEGSILENDAVIKNLEKIKHEASEIEEKSASSEEVLKNVKEITCAHDESARTCSESFFIMKNLSELHFTYEFSLEYFFSVLDKNLDKTDCFPSVLYKATHMSLLEHDKPIYRKLLELTDDDEPEEEHSLFTTIDNVTTLILSANDVSSRIYQLNSHVRSIAMGSPEGFLEADKLIDLCSRSGGWVMLKNIHLTSKDWLLSLEKKIYNMNCDSSFRLILTCEVSPIIPKTLLRNSFKYFLEPPNGMSEALSRALDSMPEERMNHQPVERCRLYFLLAWFHAVVIERLRYVPIGWSKSYEFGDADLRCAMDVIDEWVDEKLLHIAPEDIPWNTIKSILKQTTYGGRIDNSFDQRILSSLLDTIFAGPKTFEANFQLAEDVILFDGTKKTDFVQFVNHLPPSNPSWLFLTISDKFLEDKKLKRSQQLLSTTFSTQSDIEFNYLQQLAVDDSTLEGHQLSRVFEQVSSFFQMRQDVAELKQRPSEEFEKIQNYLLKNQTNPAWRQFISIPVLTVFLEELQRRLEIRNVLGHLFYPAAFLTNKKQIAARNLNVSMDSLFLTAFKESSSSSFETRVLIQGHRDEPYSVDVHLAWTQSKLTNTLPLYFSSDRSVLLEEVYTDLDLVANYGAAIIANIYF